MGEGIQSRFLRWLKGWFTVSKRSASVLGHPDLDPLDLEAISRQLKLLGRASELGQKGIPAPDATALCGPEAEIVHAVERHRQGNVDWAVRRLAVLDELLAGLQHQVAHEVNRARQADQEFTRQASLLLADCAPRLQTSGRQARAHQQELQRFRTRHALARQSRHHSAARVFLGYAVVALLIVVEGVANAFTFALGLDGGWLDGLTLAMLFAAINVALAFVVGKFLLRQLFHRHWLHKTGGCAALLFAFAAISCMALLTTHYRDRLAAGADDAAAAAAASLLAQPLAFADLFSIVLCLLSVGFGLTALIDGLLGDDLYPGYGAATRRAQHSADEYAADQQDAREDLAALREEALEQLERDIVRAHAAQDKAVADKRSTAARLGTAMADADNALRALLQRFRTENEKHRGGLPRPAYFDEYPPLAPLPLPCADVGADLQALSEQHAMVAALLAQTQDIRARIQAAFSQQFDALKTPDAIFARQNGTQ